MAIDRWQDDPLSCYQCGKNLLAWAASDLFCNETCQHLWFQRNPLTPEILGTAMADIEDAMDDVRAAFATFGSPVPTQPAPVLEVVCDAPTVVDPDPGYLPRVLRRLFG